MIINNNISGNEEYKTPTVNIQLCAIMCLAIKSIIGNSESTISIRHDKTIKIIVKHHIWRDLWQNKITRMYYEWGLLHYAINGSI